MGEELKLPPCRPKRTVIYTNVINEQGINRQVKWQGEHYWRCVSVWLREPGVEERHYYCPFCELHWWVRYRSPFDKKGEIISVIEPLDLSSEE